MRVLCRFFGSYFCCDYLPLVFLGVVDSVCDPVGFFVDFYVVAFLWHGFGCCVGCCEYVCFVPVLVFHCVSFSWGRFWRRIS